MRTTLRGIALSVLLSLAAATVGLAHQMPSKHYDCPICHTDFEWWSFHWWDVGAPYLDFDKSGYPIFFMLQCPNCRFEFVAGSQPRSAEEVEIIKEYLYSEEFKQLRAPSPPYWIYAKIESRLGKSDFVLGHLYLYALWSVFPVFKDGWEETCIREALGHFNACNPADDAPLYEKLLPMYYQVELNRRLGNFIEAAEWIEKTEQAINAAPPIENPLTEDELNTFLCSRYETKDWVAKNKPAPHPIPPLGYQFEDDRYLIGILRRFLEQQRIHVAAKNSKRKQYCQW